MIFFNMIFAVFSSFFRSVFSTTKIKNISFYLKSCGFKNLITMGAPNFRFIWLRRMNFCMFILGHYFQIFYSIIKRIFIFMMQDFFSIQFSFKKLFHYISMFKNPFSINRNYSISFRNTARTVRSIFTNRRISMSLPTSIMNTAPAFFPIIFPKRRFVAARELTYIFLHATFVPGTKILCQGA